MGSFWRHNFVVASYTFVNSATNNDVCSCGLTLIATFAPVAGRSRIWSTATAQTSSERREPDRELLIIDRERQVPGVVIADDLRIGTTWASSDAACQSPTPTPVP